MKPKFGFSWEEDFYLPCQALSYWRWADWLRSRAPAGKEVVFINLDETSVGLFHGAAKGNVVKRGRQKQPPRQNASRRALRGAVTHVAMIADRTDVQGRLPQVLIGNKHIFTLSLLAAVAATKPASVHLFREKSSWNNVAVMLRVLELLAEVMSTHFPTLQPVLVLDTVGCHVNPAVVRKANSFGIFLMIVPAKLTWLLQPLDTHVFAGYKHFLRNKYRALLEAHGRVSPVQWMTLLFEVATQYLCGNRWLPAFQAVGLHGKPERLSSDLQGLRVERPLPASVPRFLDPVSLSYLFPTNRRPIWFLWARLPWGRVRRLRLLAGGVPVQPA